MDERQRQSLAAQIRSARRAKGWTQDDLAEQAGVAPGTVLRIEKGENVRQGNLRAVLDALGIPPLSLAPPDTDPGIELAKDLVEKWLLAKEPEERNAAIQELTRWIVITRG
jgi:transcriptional regulator with XRE-family HTH domain